MSNEFSADDFVESIIQDSIHGPEYADEVAQLRADLEQAQAERDAATIEVNDLRMSGSLLANQLVCTCGGGLSKLLGCLECGTRYELISSDRLKRITDKLRVYEIAGENAPPFSSSSFEAVSHAIAERDAATRRAEQAEAVAARFRDALKNSVPWTNSIPFSCVYCDAVYDGAAEYESTLDRHNPGCVWVAAVQAGPEGGPQ